VVTGLLRMLNPFRSDRRKWGRRHNPDGTMSLTDHLYELRYRIAVAMAAVVVGGIVGFVWFSTPVFGLPTLADLINRPYCSLPSDIRFSPGGGCRLMQTKPFEVLMLRLEVGISLGAILVSPVWLYQVWAFITPGLRNNERKFAATFVALASVLFVLGAVVAYFIVPAGLTFMVGFGGNAFFTALTGGDYINFVLRVLLIFGISFEVPLLIVMLNRAGILSYERLRKWWRGVVFALFAFAAVVTPADAFSMLALVAALCVLFGIAMLVCRAHDSAQTRKLAAQGLEGLDPDQASELHHEPAPIDDPAPVDSSSGHDDVT
jgi:sec-independent protein translocase protein TatC